VLLQRLAGNAATARLLQRDADPDGAGGAANDASEATPAIGQDEQLDQKAAEIASETDNALGQRIELEPDLVRLAAGQPAEDVAGAAAAPGGASKEDSPAVSADGSVGAAPSAAPPAVDYDKQVTRQGGQTGSVYGRTGSGLDPSHVRQKGMGDCYLMAAMAAVARANPDAIRKLIKPTGDGKYAVSLYEHRWLGPDPVHTEIVDTTVPVDASGKPLYGEGDLTIKGDVEADRPLWPLLIEKAYAQWKGGWNAIGHGGQVSGALETLTGHEASQKKTSDYEPAQIGQIMEKEIKEGKALEAQTGDMPKDFTPLGTTGQAGEHQAMVGGKKVTFGHAYAVGRVEPAVMTIDLQNPWGYDHIEEMQLGDFKRSFYAWSEEKTK
jgi:hypothetical protein